MSIQRPVVPLSPPLPQPLAGTFSRLPCELPPPALRIFHGKGADGGGDSCSPRRPTIPTSASTVGSFSGAPFSPARPARLLFPAGAPVLATAGAQPLPISSSLLVIPWPNALATPASMPLRPPPCRSSSLSYAQTRPRPRPRPLSSSRVGARGAGSKPGAKAGSRRREAQGGQPGAGDGGDKEKWEVIEDGGDGKGKEVKGKAERGLRRTAVRRCRWGCSLQVGDMPLTLQRRAARLAEAITAVPRLDGETDQSIRPSPIDGEAATIHQWCPERRVRGAAAAGGEERPPCQPLRSLRGGPRPLLRWFHSSSSLDCGPPPCSQCDTIGPRLSSSALLQPASLLATPATSRCPPRQRLSRWTAGGRVVPGSSCYSPCAPLALPSLPLPCIAFFWFSW